MSSSFNIQRIAMHLVDRALDEPRYAKSEVHLDSFTEEDRTALQKFFTGHLEKAWRVEEGERTRAAVLKRGSKVAEQFRLLKKDPTSFFERSKTLADLLFDKAKSRNTTRGLLVVLWFRRRRDRRQFLGLFKMDPGPSDLVTLPPDEEASGQFLLQLVVEHVEQALPDPAAGVLKWAVLPHPDRPSYGVKLKDDEGEADLALYFQDFLGCGPRKSPKEQAEALYDALNEYAEKHHSQENYKEAVAATLENLKRRKQVDLPAVESSLKASGLERVSAPKLRERLKARDAEDLDFPSRSLLTTRFEYTLANDIVVRGPLSAKNDVTITGEPGRYEFLITTTDYQPKQQEA